MTTIARFGLPLVLFSAVMSGGCREEAQSHPVEPTRTSRIEAAPEPSMQTAVRVVNTNTGQAMQATVLSHDFVFTTQSGVRTGKRGLMSALDRALKTAGIGKPGITLHKLRRSFACMLL